MQEINEQLDEKLEALSRRVMQGDVAVLLADAKAVMREAVTRGSAIQIPAWRLKRVELACQVAASLIQRGEIFDSDRSLCLAAVAIVDETMEICSTM